MDSYGEILRKAREEKNLNVEKIAREISIESRYLTGLEEEDNGVFPGEAYMIGFLRNYSNYLELDTDYILRLYNNKKIQESLSDSEWKKYHDAETLFSELRPKILSQPLTSTLDFLWNDTGYHYETLLNINVNLLSEQFDLLFELARQTDEQGKNCAWFVEQLELARNKNSSFFGIDSDDELNLKDLSIKILVM